MSETLNDRLEEFLKARPNAWIDGSYLAQVAGKYAWRSRVSDLRRHRGLTIENRLSVIRPHESFCALHQATDGSGECSCLRPRFTISEYRYVPDLPTRVEPSGQVAFL
jgi:hypothetical protein